MNVFAGLRRAWRAVAVLLVAGSLGLGAWTALAQTVIVRTTSVPLNGSQFQGGDGDQEKPPT